MSDRGSQSRGRRVRRGANAGFWGGSAVAIPLLFIVVSIGGEYFTADWVFESFVLVLMGLGIGGVTGAVLGAVRGALTGSTGAPQTVGRPSLVEIEEPPDAWAMVLGDCEDSVHRAEHASEIVPDSAAKQWLDRIVDSMRTELDTARSLAETGRRLRPDSPQEHPVFQQLQEARVQFAEAEQQVAEIVSRLVDQPDLDQVDTELELLEQQVPHLRAPDS